jgi:uncharacterized protein
MVIVNQVSPYRDRPAGVHGVLGQAAAALAELGAGAGLEPAVVGNVADLAPADLAGAAVLALFTIGETPWSPAQRRAVEEALGRGRLAVLGVHSATDASRDWEEYGAILGGRFDGHPWTASFAVDVVDATHPATARLPRPLPWHDEVYLFSDLRPDIRVLLRIDPGQLDMSVPGARVPTHGIPLEWCHNHGAGRVFYTALGHFPGAWEDPVYLRHLAGALEWLL